MGYQIWEIPKTSLMFIRKIGSGSFGEVWNGLSANGMPVAIKIISPGIMNREESLAEAIMMKELRHPNLIQLYGVCTMDVVGPIYIVMELMKYGSLETFLQRNWCTLDLSTRIVFALKIACGMVYLESQNYIHRDLAARNILVGDDVCNRFAIKIADFGMARIIKEDLYVSRKGGFNTRWTAPEAVMDNVFTIKSDVWSFGIVLMEIVTYGQTPYDNISDDREILFLVVQGYRMPCPSGCPQALYYIMSKCWDKWYMQRPTFWMLANELQRFIYLERSAAMQALGTGACYNVYTPCMGRYFFR